MQIILKDWIIFQCNVYNNINNDDQEANEHNEMEEVYCKTNRIKSSPGCACYVVRMNENNFATLQTLPMFIFKKGDINQYYIALMCQEMRDYNFHQILYCDTEVESKSAYEQVILKEELNKKIEEVPFLPGGVLPGKIFKNGGRMVQEAAKRYYFFSEAYNSL